MPRPDATSAMNPSTIPPLVYRALAVVGVILMASDYQWQVNEPRPSSERIYAVLAAAAGVSVLLGLAPRGWRCLRRHLDLLVPFGLYYCMLAALSLLPLQAASFQLASPWTIFQHGFAAILMLVAMWVLSTLYLLWQTRLIVQVATADELDLGEGLSNSLPLLPRGLAISFLGYAGLLAPLAMAMWLGILQHSIVLILGVFLVWCLVWGFLTCLWLPLALDRSIPFWTALQQATEAGRRLWRHWSGLVVGWALALGLITLHVHSIDTPGNYVENKSWHVQGQWLGGYPIESKWYTLSPASAEVPQLGVFAVPLLLLFLCLAITVKIEIVHRVHEMRRQPTDRPEPGPLD